MVTWNAATSAVFDALLAPFGHEPAWSPWFDLLVWSLIAGVLALWVYKKVSNQAAIAAAKDRIQAHVLEIRLFRHDPLQVLVSAGKALARNAIYLGHNLVPMAVLTLPMLAVLSQLVANYALDPVPEGSVQMLELKLDPRSGVSPRDVKLELPPGVALDAPPVRTADGEVFWRLRAETAGDHELVFRVGDETVRKQLAVGGPHRKLAQLRTKSWEALLYPGEPALPRGSAVESVSLAYPPRDLGPLPNGELGVLAGFLFGSIAVGFALKGLFGVTL
jgi:hypothetical protein